MKKSKANFIINSIIKECRSRRFCCHGCPFIDERYGHCTFCISNPREWTMRKETHKYKIEHLKEGDKSELSSMKYYICCPMCDKDKCVRGTEECDAEKWEKEKIVGEKWRKEKEGE